jgi:23S rRNA pseudouridine2604 synthase
MNIKLDKLATGKWRYLSEPEINTLLDSVKESDADEISIPKLQGKSNIKTEENPEFTKEKLTFQKTRKAPPKDPDSRKKPKKSSYKEYRKNKK